MTEPETQIQKGSKKAQLSALQLAQRQTAALRHGLNAKDENARRLRDKRTKMVRRRAKKELADNPWYGAREAQILRRAIDLEIILDGLIARYDEKGGAASGQATLQSKILAFTDKARAWRQTLPARPETRLGACDLSDPNFKMPLKCWDWLRDTVLADAEGTPEPPAPVEQPRDDALIREALSIIEGGTTNDN